jgi:hypothetical protein
MLAYHGEKIGERGGFIHSYGGNFYFVVTGFFLQGDGCMAVGIREEDGHVDTGWAYGFNRSKEEVVKQVNALPLTKEQRLELLQNGIYPKEIKIESHQYYKGYPRAGMFDELLHLVE